MDEKMKYADFEVVDFLNDEFFIQWVKNPGEETDHFWLKWIENNPDRRVTVQKAREIIGLVQYKTRYELSDQAYMDLYENIVEKSHQTRPDGRHFQWSGWHKVAAILLMVFSAVYSIDFFGGQKDNPVESSPKRTLLSVHNPAGQKYKFKLPDGTVVHLNAESSIEYPETFAADQREVHMTGEAYFEVTKNTDRPFVIHTERNQVRVLGTSFNLKEGENFELALVEGKVEVEDPDGEVITLLPNQMLIKDKNGAVSMSAFDPMVVFGWKDQNLVFKDNTYSEVLAKLESWYGVTIQSNLTISEDWSYSGRYRNKPLDQVLDGISISSEFKYEIVDKTVIISNP
ncbi:FecR family protein [Algoriphagus terrigena]|uniref:FecR family protein n=1 Tax=Algoriphagus terrigena TaxID=344884 RepID=UPI001FE0B1B1|nr:FecR domain-containing protein [Algoriphagus terrigena]